MARLIDADALIRRAVERYKQMMGTDIGHGMGIIASMITDAPTVDAEEVVRCRDCKYIYFNKAYNSCLCRNTNGLTSHLKADYFCSYGERKTNE